MREYLKFSIAGNWTQAVTAARAAFPAGIRGGTVSITHTLDISAPFDGYKQSGNGREWGAFGFDEYLETKRIVGYASRDA